MSWYFQKTHPFWVVAISFGMGLLGMLEYKPELVCHDRLWILGKLTRLLAEEYPKVITAIWYPAVAVHVIEACVSFNLAQKKGLSTLCATAWFAQTLCFGYASLCYILAYNPKSD